MAAYLSNISKIARTPALTSNLNRYGEFCTISEIKERKSNRKKKIESKSKMFTFGPKQPRNSVVVIHTLRRLRRRQRRQPSVTVAQCNESDVQSPKSKFFLGFLCRFAHANPKSKKPFYYFDSILLFSLFFSSMLFFCLDRVRS